MLKKNIWILVICLFIHINAFGEEIPNKINLQPNVNIGDIYRFHSYSLQKAYYQDEKTGKPITDVTEGDMIYSWEVLDVTDQSYTIGVSLENFNYKQDSINGVISFDSSNLPCDFPLLLAHYVMRWVQDCIIKYHKNGEIEIIQGYEPQINQYLNNLTQSRFALPEGGREFLYNYYMNSIGDEALKEGYLDVSTPDHPVEIGESWQKHIVSKFNLPSVSELNCTLTAFQEGIIYVEGVSEISPNLDAPPPIVFGESKTFFELSGQMTFKEELDGETKVLIRSHKYYDLSGQMRIEGLKDQETMITPLRYEVTETQKLLDFESNSTDEEIDTKMKTKTLKQENSEKEDSENKTNFKTKTFITIAFIIAIALLI